MTDLPCINQNESLFDLIQAKRKIKDKITIAAIIVTYLLVSCW